MASIPGLTLGFPTYSGYPAGSGQDTIYHNTSLYPTVINTGQAQLQNTQASPTGTYNDTTTSGPYVDNTYGGYGSAAAQTQAQEAARSWQDQIGSLQNLLGATDTNLNQGLLGLQDSYNLQNSRLNDAQSQTLSGYQTKRVDTNTDKNNALNAIDSSARNNYNSLQRLLGLGNAGVSSAAQYAVPMAVSRQASQQRGSTIDTYGRNLRNLDTAEAQAKTSYGNALADLLSQRRDKESALRSGVLTQQQQINQELADANQNLKLAQGADWQTAYNARQPFMDQVNQRQSALSALFDQFRNPTYNVNPVQVSSPNMEQYTVDNRRVGTSATSDPNEANYASYLPYINQLKDQKLALY